MPTAEYSSVTYTFSMSRCAIRLPWVARRSPAISTPPAKVQRDDRGAVRHAPARPARRARIAARRQQLGRLHAQEVRERGRARREVRRRQRGTRRPVLSRRAQKSHRACRACSRVAGPAESVSTVGRADAERLLAALLHVGAHEVLGVLLEHVVDLVEDGVDVLAELLAPFLTRGAGAVDLLVGVAAALALRSVPGPSRLPVWLTASVALPSGPDIRAVTPRSPVAVVPP